MTAAGALVSHAQPSSRPENDGHAAALLVRPQQQPQQKRQQRTGQQFGERAPPVDHHKVIRIDRVQHGRKGCVAPVKPLPRQQKHGNTRACQHDPNVDAGDERPGKDRAKGRSQNPRGRGIEDEAWLAISEVRQGRPPGINDTVFPLRKNLQPRVRDEIRHRVRKACREKRKEFPRRRPRRRSRSAASRPDCSAARCARLLVDWRPQPDRIL